MIEHCTGSLFDSGADALVVPVNCVGVAGKGLALEFKEQFPEWFDEYREHCRRNLIWIGHCFVHRRRCCFGSLSIIDFPTKDHWRSRSTLNSIERGLNEQYNGLRAVLNRHTSIASVAVPALGCGLGGLDWKDVRPLIEEALGDLETRVLLYGPKED